MLLRIITVLIAYERPKASAIYDATKNIEAVGQILGHSSLAATIAYPRIEQAEALDITQNHRMI